MRWKTITGNFGDGWNLSVFTLNFVAESVRIHVQSILCLCWFLHGRPSLHLYIPLTRKQSGYLIKSSGVRAITEGDVVADGAITRPIVVLLSKNETITAPAWINEFLHIWCQTMTDLHVGEGSRKCPKTQKEVR